MNQPRSNFQAIKGTIKQLFGFYLLFISIFFLGRLGLFVLYYDRIVDANVNQWYSFLIGLQLDTIVASIILVVPTLMLFGLPKFMGTFTRYFLRIYFLLFILLAVYIENATFPFLAEFDVRPNEIFINYLAFKLSVISIISLFSFTIITEGL